MMISLVPINCLLYALLVHLARADGGVCGGESHVIEIASQADADALSNCSLIDGPVAVTGDIVQTIKLNGVKKIAGDLNISGCTSLRGFSAPDLTHLGNFTLFNLPRLSVVDVPSLTDVSFGLSWKDLPMLENASFPANLSQASQDTYYGSSEITISNTSISLLNGFNFSKIVSIEITNNSQLSIIDLTELDDVRGMLRIAENAPSASVYLPSLLSAGSAVISNAISVYSPKWHNCIAECELSNNRFTNISSILGTDYSSGLFSFRNNPLLLEISLPSVEFFSALTIENNDMLVNVTFQNVTAFEQLTIRNNPQLSNIDLPSLIKVTDDEYLYGDGDEVLTIVDNPSLSIVAGMPKLESLGTTTIMSGNFSRVEFPSLLLVDEGFHLNTTFPDFDCTAFDKLYYQYYTDTSDEGDHYYCQAIAPGTTEDTAIHASAPSKPAKPLSGDAKLGIGIGSGILFILSLFYIIRWYREYRNKQTLLLQLQAGHNADNDGTWDVEDGEDLDDLPPLYKPVGEVGEVPPVYDESVSESAPRHGSVGEGEAPGRNTGQRENHPETPSGGGPAATAS